MNENGEKGHKPEKRQKEKTNEGKEKYNIPLGRWIDNDLSYSSHSWS